MSERVNFVRRITAVMILGLLVVPLIASSASLEEDDRKESEQELNWWENTNMDTNKDRFMMLFGWLQKVAIMITLMKIIELA